MLARKSLGTERMRIKLKKNNKRIRSSPMGVPALCYRQAHMSGALAACTIIKCFGRILFLRPIVLLRVPRPSPDRLLHAASRLMAIIHTRSCVRAHCPVERPDRVNTVVVYVLMLRTCAACPPDNGVAAKPV